MSILMLLDEGPMHGYEIITTLDERTSGAWKPSPGSMYPALSKLTEKGFIAVVGDSGSHDGDETQRYELTKLGRRRVAEMKASGITEPWTEHTESEGGDLRRATAELMGPVRQIGRFGSVGQVAAARNLIADTTAQLYRILADGATASNDE